MIEVNRTRGIFPPLPQQVPRYADGEGAFSIHLTLPSSSSDAEIQSMVDDASNCVKEIIGIDVPFTVTAVSGYNMHALIATKYRVGRCLFAGDSAHQWLPAGGLGQNTGASDAADLAWKLEAVLKGYASEDLLDAYELERRPMANDFSNITEPRP